MKYKAPRAVFVWMVCLLGCEAIFAEEPTVPTFVILTPYRQMGIFRECTGMGSENDVVEHKIVDANGQEMIVKMPGPLRVLDVTCRRGISVNDELSQWRRLVEEGRIKEARKNVFIESLDRDLNVVVRWEISNAWPKRIVYSSSDPLGVEELVLVSEGIKRVPVPPAGQ